MKLFLVLILALWIPQASAAPWELCLDQGDFSLNVDAIFKASKVAKFGCRMRFIAFGARGEKYEVNLCDSNIHIEVFPSIESNEARRVAAGSGNCPKPLFGSDIDIPDTDGVEYAKAKTRIVEIFKNVMSVYGEKIDQLDLSKVDGKGLAKSDMQLACGKLLLDDYLGRCIAFEEKKAPVVTVRKDPLPKK